MAAHASFWTAWLVCMQDLVVLDDVVSSHHGRAFLLANFAVKLAHNLCVAASCDCKLQDLQGPKLS